ncbi:MFS transporter [Rhizobium sp. Leaf384]|uniref:MFS transporter n=1 Tax=unclassified Rhizobium TaxID=2613769 RepID=UPI0007145C87|nr:MULTISPECIES: MFS transporter [unclassified Rhizobium]KQS77706.1 MFS transporter [Rhizobium sp. Leaf384]KQS84517.1 MFS transporter [Rhizobium sp. Leaf383]
MQQAGTITGNRSRLGGRITLALAMLLASLGTSIANIALPTLSREFAAPFAEVQAVVVAYLLAMTVTVVHAGRLGDAYGLKRTLLAGLGLFFAGSLLGALAPDLWTLIGARALQGVGAAFLMTLSMALMRETASAGSLGRAMGLLGTVSALGTALGPTLGGLVIPILGGRGIFWVQVPLAAIASVMAFALLPARVPAVQPDLMPHADSGGQGKGKSQGAGQGRAAAAPLRAMLRHGLLPHLIVNVLVANVMMTTLVVAPFYLGQGLGLTDTRVGLLMAVGPVISIVSGVPSGRMVDAWGSRRVLLVGLVLMAAGAFALAFLPNRIGVAGYVLSILVLTPGYQLFQSANNTEALADVAPDRRGTVSGLLNLSRNLGLIGGASLMGTVFAHSVGTKALALASPAAMAGGLQRTFLLAGGIVTLAIVVQGLARRWARAAPAWPAVSG